MSTLRTVARSKIPVASDKPSVSALIFDTEVADAWQTFTEITARGSDTVQVVVDGKKDKTAHSGVQDTFQAPTDAGAAKHKA